MGRVVRLTEQELTGLLKDIIGMISGNDKVSNSVNIDSKSNTQTNTSVDSSNVSSSSNVTSSNNVVGSGWKSCKSWRAKGGLNKWGDKIKVNKGPNQFKITYTGPQSGLNIAHAANGGDTIHQLYNVLICEINPFLSQGKMMPKIENIKTEGGKNGTDSTISITVPIEKSEDTYQIDRRGGWGHDPGSSKMDSKCKEVNRKGGKCFGPIKNILQAPFGKITEYFIAHTI